VGVGVGGYVNRGVGVNGYVGGVNGVNGACDGVSVLGDLVDGMNVCDDAHDDVNGNVNDEKNSDDNHNVGDGTSMDDTHNMDDAHNMDDYQSSFDNCIGGSSSSSDLPPLTTNYIQKRDAITDLIHRLSERTKRPAIVVVGKQLLTFMEFLGIGKEDGYYERLKSISIPAPLLCIYDGPADDLDHLMSLNRDVMPCDIPCHVFAFWGKCPKTSFLTPNVSFFSPPLTIFGNIRQHPPISKSES